MELFTTHPRQGAYHISEIPEVFGTYLPNPTAAQVELSKTMQTLWANMAKHPQSGPTSGWEKLQNSGMQVREFGGKDVASVGSVMADVLDKNCTKYVGIGQLLGVLW
jgi:carboxylesterase type B